MTVTSLLPKVTALGNDVATSFSFSPIVIFEASDLEVTHVDADGVETVLELGAGADNYSVDVASYPGTGSVVYPADEVTPMPTGESLVIKRVLPLTQETNLTNQGPYLPKVQERQFDRLVMIAQQLKAAIDLCVELPALGFSGLAGAVPRVNSTEDDFEWALGLTGSKGDAGPAGATGPAGSPGQMGPWEHIGTHTLPTGTGTYEITDIGSSVHRALMLVFLDCKVATDDTFIALRFKKNGTTKATNYKRVTRPAASDDLADLAGSATSTGIPLSGGIAGSDVGNAANESLSGYCIVYDPHTAGIIHRVTGHFHLTYPDGQGGDNVIGGMYDSTDATDAITSLTVASSGNLNGGTVLVYGLRAHNPPVVAYSKIWQAAAPTASQVIHREVFTGDVTYLENLSGTLFSAKTAATAQAVFDVKKNGVSVGSITWAAAGTVPTIAVVGGVAFASGNILEIIAPATPDATLAGISGTLIGFADTDALQSLWVGSLT